MFAASKTASVSGGYQISRSLRFNRADSAYLNRTPASATNRKTWTWSAWVKRGQITSGQTQTLFSAGSSAVTGWHFLNSSDILELYDYSGGYNWQLNTTQVFRDVSAWYHIVVAFDTTQATASNRLKLYVNGTQVTSFSTANYPALNTDYQVNNNVVSYVGRSGLGTIYDFDGYQTEINLIDGQALTPSSFGETNAQTGVWTPIAYSGSYGTNGFYLNFSDNSNTTAATLGKDYSGNGNNWTPNNFSVSAGAGNDSLVDSPTSYGTDTGVGGTVRGNYCTLNPLNAGSTATLSNGNLNITGTIAATTSLAYSTIGVSSGKWYWEVTPLTGDHMIGIGKDGGRYDWQTTNGYSYFGNNGQKYTNSAGSAYGATYANNDVIGVGLDMDAGTLTFYKNGTSQGTAFSGLTGTWFPIAQNPGSPLTEAFNFGQRPFAYTAPSGYKALCTQNLPTPTIGATTATLANKYFDISLWTGNGSSQTITNSGSFQPDWVWTKGRSNADSNVVVNAIAGANQFLVTESTQAEATSSALVSAFTSSGFSIGSSTSINRSSSTYVGWQWKANGSGSTNTAGSITSTVSANTTSGFSVVTYTGNGTAGATIGHGLGVAPSMMFIKGRTNVDNWHVYSSALGNTGGVFLNLTNAFTVSSYFWNDTSPSSTVFTVSSGSSNNSSGVTYVCYAFAEVAGYSKFGSYTGNGSTDGPFVYCGFKPEYLLWKRTDSGTWAWYVHDLARSPYNATILDLVPNASSAEDTDPSYAIDFLSNGFKIRSTFGSRNGSGGTYIFMAFATNPFKYSLAQ